LGIGNVYDEMNFIAGCPEMLNQSSVQLPADKIRMEIHDRQEEDIQHVGSKTHDSPNRNASSLLLQPSAGGLNVRIFF